MLFSISATGPWLTIPGTITIYARPTTPTNISASPSSWCNGRFVNFSTTPSG
ncbi:MAG: hypothetical protein ABIT08_06195 [Bacteroidia bacterium]